MVGEASPWGAASAASLMSKKNDSAEAAAIRTHTPSLAPILP